MSSFFDTLTAAHIRDLPMYQPGKPVEELERELGIRDAVKAASNENPLGPSPRAVEAATQALSKAHLYPIGDAFYLRRALAQRLDIAPERLVFGAGSNEVIYLIMHALCRPGQDEVLTHKYAFISYKLCAMAYDLPFVEVDVAEDLSCDADALIAAMGPRTKVVLLANPNNPTGIHVPRGDFERILAALPPQAVLVVDEAYYEYAVSVGEQADYPSSLTYQSEREPRIITLRTFSKIYGLAGLRVGYGIGHPEVMNRVERVSRAFNVNSVAQAAALAALDDDAHITRSQQAARASIERLSRVAEELGLRPYPSLTNFLLLGFGRPAAPVYEAMLRRGAIVRPMAAWGLPEHLRISVGTEAETERVAEALRASVGDVLG
ncbi:histidinol-phosphate aminotransferase [Haliangium ochraceum DSM 14365]|uniref:Histidinol-phosphate aminotransferase n=2 Tax=Haliangium ochraceum TaxID=80816 RepID=D0LTT1_HALO1|nr:histidinol-phosphate aminotransferase [Haliangium ochraceum DSM 14365]